MDQDKGFFALLFDFSFSEFITEKVIRFLYAIAVIAAAIASLGMLVNGIRMLGDSILTGLGMIIITPLAFILYVIVARVYLELIMVIFHIEDHVEKIAAGTPAQEPPAQP
jgi:hypothetical protein